MVFIGSHHDRFSLVDRGVIEGSLKFMGGLCKRVPYLKVVDCQKQCPRTNRDDDEAISVADTV
ncbi:hypothetical protein ASD79_21410 [Caulobacter sp. Root655]|nr:hypothetical protein ASD79_21410 [Caulobacter sp. Root655]